MTELTGLKSPFSVIRKTVLRLIKQDVFTIQQCTYIELMKQPINWLYGSANAYYMAEIITHEERNNVLVFLEYHAHSFRPSDESTSHVSHVVDYFAHLIKGDHNDKT